jgi:hypothetical protein
MTAIAQPRLLIGFARYKTPDLLTFGNHVVAELTGNVNFTILNPTIPVVETSVGALQTANDDAMGGGQMAIAIRAQAKIDTIALLRQLVTSIENQANGDRVKLISSGFAVSKIPGKVGQLPPPAPPEVTQGMNPGEIKCKVSKPKGASGVIWRIALVATPGVYLETVSSAGGRYTFTGLTAGTVYLVQAALTCAAGQTGWSPTSALMAL